MTKAQEQKLAEWKSRGVINLQWYTQDDGRVRVSFRWPDRFHESKFVVGVRGGVECKTIY